MMSDSGVWTVRGGRQLHPAPFCVVGIVNVTPDSFFDGGSHERGEEAVRHGLALLKDGAGMLDLGAESSRPFAAPVPLDEELRRVLPPLKALRAAAPDAFLSVDTYKAVTAAAALEAGADVINDISGWAFEPELLEVIAQFRPGYVLMHSSGTPETMQISPSYTNVVEEVFVFFEEKLTSLIKAGLPEDRIVLDPGIGFGKSAEHSVALLRHVEQFARLGRPLYMGLSMKSLFGRLLGLPLQERGRATQVATALLAARGVRYHRVHDVAGAVEALRLTQLMTPGLKI